nr:hypothetical protein [Tanacetum cinerariifolium]
MSSASSAVTYTSVYTKSKPGRPVAQPSSDYVPGPEHPSSPDFVPSPELPPSPVYVSYVPEVEYPEYLDPEENPEEDHADYPTDGGDDDDDDDDTDNEDEEHFEDEEEHLAPADSPAVPVIDPVPSAEDT